MDGLFVVFILGKCAQTCMTPRPRHRVRHWTKEKSCKAKSRYSVVFSILISKLRLKYLPLKKRPLQLLDKMLELQGEIL